MIKHPNVSAWWPDITEPSNYSTGQKTSKFPLSWSKPIWMWFWLGSSRLEDLSMLQVVQADNNGTPLDQRQLQGVF